MPNMPASSWTALQSFKMVALSPLASNLTTNNTSARLFNSSPISPRKCRTLLTKIAVLLFTGEKFPTNEATTLFFGISKLFQNKDPSLRQMVYLIVKELASSAEDIIMFTAIIQRDVTIGERGRLQSQCHPIPLQDYRQHKRPGHGAFDQDCYRRQITCCVVRCPCFVIPSPAHSQRCGQEMAK